MCCAVDTYVGEVLTLLYSHRFLLHAERRRRTIPAGAPPVRRRGHPTRDAIREERCDKNTAHRRGTDGEERYCGDSRYVTPPLRLATVFRGDHSSDVRVPGAFTLSLPTRSAERAAQARSAVHRNDHEWDCVAQEAPRPRSEWAHPLEHKVRDTPNDSCAVMINIAPPA